MVFPLPEHEPPLWPPAGAAGSGGPQGPSGAPRLAARGAALKGGGGGRRLPGRGQSGCGAVGLVLSGGGGKGAYEAGAVKALAELGLSVSAVSGASVGALNGAAVSAAADLREAAGRLCRAWGAPGGFRPLRLNPRTVARAFAAVFKEPPPAAGAGLPSWLAKAGEILSGVSEGGLFSTEPLRELLDACCGDEELERGLPLYVSLYPDDRRGAEGALGEFFLSSLGAGDTGEPVFRLVQSLPRGLRKDAILASAALPFLYPSGKVGDGSFRDGGLGGWKSREGNTPAAPLLNAGFRRLVVISLESGSPWKGPEGSEAAALVISPSAPLAGKGRIPALLDFTEDSRLSWLRQGYRDVMARAGEVKGFLDGEPAPRKALQGSPRRLPAPAGPAKGSGAVGACGPGRRPAGVAAGPAGGRLSRAPKRGAARPAASEPLPAREGPSTPPAGKDIARRPRAGGAGTSKSRPSRPGSPGGPPQGGGPQGPAGHGEA
ncbi:MAG: patatin-like phospholipase family protein [Deltaproteobacteria bacterium]|jgi:NTE family protein|nr:patatin-like phospholipase family protein [Deltaproteobacteria bacterium]